MKKSKKVDLRNLLISGAIAAFIITILSIPLGPYPAIGNLMFPGENIWSIPHEVPLSEDIYSSEISADVTVYRDEWGIPHIYGSDEGDIIYALGYVHAQDRMFQMDMARRATRGKLAEVLGPDLVETDKYNLNMLKDYWSNATVNLMKTSNDPEVQKLWALLQDYCEGVNYWIDTHKDDLPLEFIFLGYEPSEWLPVDSLCFAKYMSEMLTWGYIDFYTLLLREAWGKNNFTELFDLPRDYQIPICPNYGSFDDISPPPSELSADIGQNLAGSGQYDESESAVTDLFSSLLKGIQTIPQEAKRIEAMNKQQIGSNNWVVNGSKTASGYPILCNDMHLAYELPGIWYEAHLVDTSSDWNVYGFFLAGVPVPIVGHNNYVGWGFTNTAYDVLDWYYYNGINDTHYLYKDADVEYDLINYTINVKGESSIDYAIKNTVHGPVFSDFLSDDVTGRLSDSEIACKWIAHNITWEFMALYGYSHAQNRAEFDTASANFSTPAQNHIYADIHGDIGIRPTGKVPIRDDSTYSLPGWHLGNGSMPYNGSKGQGEWNSYVPFEDLPHSENPEQCYLTSANQIVAGPDFLKQYSLQNPLSIAAGYRARRLNTILAASDDLTVDDMKDIQLDVYSTRAGNFTPILLNALGGLGSLTPLQQNAYDVLNEWDYVMDKLEPAPSIFNVWMEVFQEMVFADEPAYSEVDYLPPYPVLEKLCRTDPNANWFNNISTPVVEDRDDIMIAAFNVTVEVLQDYYDTSQPDLWFWRNLHFAEFPHITGLDPLGAGPYDVNGTGYTVTPTWGSNWDDGAVEPSFSTGGASERLIVDFSNLNNSVSVIPSGQRGVSSSKHYTDQLELYLAGEYHTQYFSSTTTALFKDKWIESKIYFYGTGGA